MHIDVDNRNSHRENQKWFYASIISFPRYNLNNFVYFLLKPKSLQENIKFNLRTLENKLSEILIGNTTSQIIFRT